MIFIFEYFLYFIIYIKPWTYENINRKKNSVQNVIASWGLIYFLYKIFFKIIYTTNQNEEVTSIIKTR